jgi:hypothetical protein
MMRSAPRSSRQDGASIGWSRKAPSPPLGIRWKDPIEPGELALDKLANNLHAILTIADPLLPHAGLKKATEHLLQGV